MRPGPRRLTWNEFKQLHSHLNESEILKLFNIEEERWRLFEAEERRIIEIKNQKIVDKAQALNNQLIEVFTSRGGFVPKPNPNPPVETYSTPGTFNLTVPDSGEFKKYNQVIIEAVGGGGVGTRGKLASLPSAIWIAAGGGGGAYSKKTYPITEASVISITVGAGSSTHEVNGGDSTATVDGVTITAGGGESLIINQEDVNGDAVSFSEIEGPASGGTASGGDVNTNGNDGEPGQARAINSGEVITGPPDGIGDGGAGAGPFGGAGGITSKYKTTLGGQPDNNYPTPNSYSDEYAKATDGQQPGGGGGGGGPRNSLYYYSPLTPGNGGDGQIKVTYGYS